jgi:hypothetical protein
LAVGFSSSAEYLFCGQRACGRLTGATSWHRSIVTSGSFLSRLGSPTTGRVRFPRIHELWFNVSSRAAALRIASRPWTPTFPASSCSASTPFERAGSRQMVKTRNTLATSSGSHLKKQRPPIAAFWGYSSRLMRSHRHPATYTSAHGNGWRQRRRHHPWNPNLCLVESSTE